MGNIGSKKAAPHLATIPYPPYGVQTVGQCHLLVAGGGGAAKTGVKNKIDIYQIELATEPNDLTLQPLKLTHVASLDTGTGATMHFSFDDSHYIAAGQDASTFIYSLLPNVIYQKGDKLFHQPIAEAIDTDQTQRNLSYDIIAKRNYQTDFQSPKCKSPYQKCCAIQRHRNGEQQILIAGGTDGRLRIFKAISGVMLAETDAHKGEIDSMDLSTDGSVCITIGHDNQWFLWRTADASKLLDLSVPDDLKRKNIAFRPRFVKFTMLGRHNIVFVAIFIPTLLKSKSACTFLSLWSYNMQNNRVTCIECRKACDEVASTMAVSSSGDYTTIGTLSGSVGIYDTHTFTQLYFAKETHTIFCTGVTVLPNPLDAYKRQQHQQQAFQMQRRQFGNAKLEPPLPPLTLCSESKVTVLSISADQSVQLHAVPLDSPMKGTLASLLLKMTLFSLLVYFILVAIGLNRT